MRMGSVLLRNRKPLRNMASQGEFGRPNTKLDFTLNDLISCFPIREAAYIMDLYVRNPLNWDFDPCFSAAWQTGPCTVLELGSGTGIVGSRIADEFAQRGKDVVIVTDLPDVCPLLEVNLSRQLAGDGVIHVRPLAWGNLEHALHVASELRSFSDGHSRVLTHIVCSDLVSVISKSIPVRVQLGFARFTFPSSSLRSSGLLFNYPPLPLFLFWRYHTNLWSQLHTGCAT